MPRRGARETVERGIYRDKAGYEVVAKVGRLRRSKRFPLDTSLGSLRTWRDGETASLRDELQPTADSRTLKGSIARYRRVTNMPADHAYQPALNAWIREHGAMERRKLTPAIALQTIERWKQAGYGPQSLYYRRLVIEKLWKTLDGPRVRTPVDDITITRPKSRRPVWVQDDVILRVLMELRRQEMAGRLRSAKTRARFLVLVTTGQRPAQLKLARRGDVDFWRAPVEGLYGVWHVRQAKGGEPVPLYLNSEMRDAWAAFVTAKAWGWYDTRSFARTIRHAGWPAGIRIYNVRHATGFTMSAKGVDLGDIQLAYGHSTPATTRIYVGAIDERMREVATKIEGRFRGK